YEHQFELTEGLIGGIAIDETGDPLPDETLALCHESDAVLLGAVGGPKWDDPTASVRPEQGLLRLRKELDLFANLRPVRVYPALAGASTLQRQVVEDVDLVIVRELTGGIYFGRPSGRQDTGAGRAAVDTCTYTEGEIERLMRVAFDLARQRRKPVTSAGSVQALSGAEGKVTSVDKANVLSTSRLWRQVAHEVATDYPDVAYEDLLVDAAAMHLIRRPADFDVVATENLFGDILSDEASMLAGSMGMLPSASLGEARSAGGRRFGLYEPVHGSAPDIAGQGISNPLATILSVAMLLRVSLGLNDEADQIEQAVADVLAAGYRTADIMSDGMTRVGTTEMGDLVVERLRK
ncbi:MAG: 3-isopropylmalate dehydrogenase, partial [Anaerolineae bacterium]